MVLHNKVFNGFLVFLSVVISTISQASVVGSVVGVGYAYRSSVQSYVCEHPNVIRELTEQARQNAWDDGLHNCKLIWTGEIESESVSQKCSKTMTGEYSLKVIVRGEFGCIIY